MAIKYLIIKDHVAVNDENDMPIRFDSRDEAMEKLEEYGGQSVQEITVEDEMVEADGGI